jgi:pimeloyl-ACP methyl ester carboxylesterase
MGIEVRKTSLYHEDTGTGRAIVLVHGIPTDYRAWNAQKDTLVSRNFKMIALSRRLSYPNDVSNIDKESSTVQNNAKDIVDLIQELDLKQVHLVGHSFGGFVSLYAVWKHPELFRSLVLVEPAVPSILVKNESNPFQVLWFLLTNPSAALSARRFQNGKLKQCLKAFREGDLKKAVEYFYDGIREENGAFEKLPPSIRDMMNHNGTSVAELGLEFPIFTKKDANSINLPVLLIKGENSPQWLRAIIDSLGKAIPTSKIVEIPNSGHLPHIEEPKAFNDALTNFLSQV